MKLFIRSDLPLKLPAAILLLLLAGLDAPFLSAQVINWSYEEIVPDTYQSGGNPDLYADASGNFHVSFWQVEEDKLGYASRDQATGQWTVEQVPDPALCGYASAVMAEADGTVHIAYHADRAGEVVLKHASRAPGGSWSLTTVVDTAYIGLYGADLQYPTHMRHSLDIYQTAAGQVAMAYFNADYGLVLSCTAIGLTYFNYEMDLEVAVLDQGRWQPYAFANVPYQGPFPSCINRGDRFGEFVRVLEQPGGGRLALTTSMHNNELLFYRGNSVDPGGWSRFALDSLSRYVSNPRHYEAFGFIDAKLDNVGQVHATYHTTDLYGATGLVGNRQRLVYARFDPDSMGLVGYAPYRYVFPGSQQPRYYATVMPQDSLRAYLTYFDRNNSLVLSQATKNGGLTWDGPDTLLRNVTVSAPLRSEISGDSLIVLAPDNRSDQILTAALDLTDANADWRHGRATVSEELGEQVSSVVERSGSDDQMWVAYHDGRNGGVTLAERSNGSWSYESISPVEGLSLGDMDLVRSASQDLFLAYAEDPGNVLHLAHRVGGTWVEEVLPGEPTATQLSLAAEGDELHLCYYDPFAQELRYGFRATGGTWQLSLVDSVGDFVGRLPSLKVDSLGGLHVGYFAQLDRQLRYAYRPAGGNWTTEVVDLPNPVEIPSLELALRSNAEPSIAFKDNAVDSIFLAEKINGSWQSQEVEANQSATSGRPLRLLIDGKDRPWVLYNFPTTLNELRLVRRNLAGEWRQVSVLNNNAAIAGEFDFHRLDTDFYIIGRQNQPGETGVGLLFSPNGVQTNLPSLAEEIGLTLAPNPTAGQGQLRWQQPQSARLSLALYNLAGQQVYTKNESTWRSAGTQQVILDLSSLPPGLYLLQMQLGAQRYQAKVIRH